jgi:hypothetical protein
MQAVFVAHHKLGAQHVIRIASSLVSSASTVAHQRSADGQLCCQQQIAQTFQHGNRLVISHRDGDQQAARSPSTSNALAARLTAIALRRLPSALSFSQMP